MLWIINLITPVKVDEAMEEIGLDESLHGESAYDDLQLGEHIGAAHIEKELAGVK